MKTDTNLCEQTLTQEELDEIDALEDFDLTNTKPTHEVWLLGYDKDDHATDFEILIDDGYESLTEANKCFDYFSDKNILERLLVSRNVEIPAYVLNLHLVVETVVEEDDRGLTCIDTSKELVIDADLLR